jgi:hypothetical protein
MTLGMMKVPTTGSGSAQDRLAADAAGGTGAVGDGSGAAAGTAGAGEQPQDPLANRQFTTLRLREQSTEPRPIKRHI